MSGLSPAVRFERNIAECGSMIGFGSIVTQALPFVSNRGESGWKVCRSVQVDAMRKIYRMISACEILDRKQERGGAT